MAKVNGLEGERQAAEGRIKATEEQVASTNAALAALDAESVEVQEREKEAEELSRKQVGAVRRPGVCRWDAWRVGGAECVCGGVGL
jgi:chromosome segregation ATPase